MPALGEDMLGRLLMLTHRGTSHLLSCRHICAGLGRLVFWARSLLRGGLLLHLFAWMQTSAHFYMLRLILGLAESGAYPGTVSQLPHHLLTIFLESNVTANVTAATAWDK